MTDCDTWERDYQLSIPLGSLVKVFWTGERRWFFGVIDDTRREDGKRIHHVTYRDGDKKWHHLPSEFWLQVKDMAKEKAEKAAVKAAANVAAAAKAAAEEKVATATVAATVAATTASDKQVAATRKAAEAVPAAVSTLAKAPPSRRPKASKKRPRVPMQSRFVDTPLPLHWVERDVVPVVESVPALPPVPARSIEHFPFCVIKLAGFLSDETRQRLYDNVMIAGWDHRVSGSYADSVYTNAQGAPNILLHWNYYSAPQAAQPPPMAVLQIADAVYRGYRDMEGAHQVAATDESDRGSDGESDRGSDRGSETAAGTGVARAGPEARAESEASCSTDGSAPVSRRGKAETRGDTSSSAASSAASSASERAALRGLAASPTQAEKEQELEEERRSRCAFPAHPDFQSVLALGYRASDTFRWHTDMAGDDGWVCSFSLGATATFEYLPKIAPSAKKRSEARSEVGPIRVPIGCGDCLLFHGGYLPHRITHCGATPSAAFARMNTDPSVVRLNLQVRV